MNIENKLIYDWMNCICIFRVNNKLINKLINK